MTVETFFEKFELLAAARDAVEKMRELILAMAVQGRLSDRLSNDPPVDNLVQQLRDSKKRHSRSREGSEEEAAPIELPYPVPSHWTCLRLCDIGAISGGHTPSKNNNRFWNGDVQWFTSKDIKTNELYESELKITEAAAESPGLQLYPPGCLFMVARSGILKRTFPVAINRVPATANQDLKVLRPFVSGLERYLQIMFRGLTPFILSDLVKTGMTVQSLKYDEFAVQPFPLPPLAEQKRIVAKVDELMGLCDRLEEQQQEREQKHADLSRAALARFADSPTPANLDYLFHNAYTIGPADLRKSILTLAVQGKLMEQDSGDEPAAILIARIRSEKAELVRKKLLRFSSAHTMRDVDDVDGDLPNGWEWILVDEIASIGTGSTPLKSERDYYANGDVPWVTSAATNHQFIERPEQFVTKKAVADCNLRLYPKGSLLIALYGQGKTRGQVGQLMFDSTTNQACAVLEFFGSSEAVRDYVRLFFLKKYDELREQAAGGAQPNLSGGMIRLTRIPLPPLAEQRRIVAKVEALMRLVDGLEAQLADSRQLATRLLAAAVAELTNPKAS